jgi:hypothetical protein
MQPKTRVELTGANGHPVSIADDKPSMDIASPQPARMWFHYRSGGHNRTHAGEAG